MVFIDRGQSTCVLLKRLSSLAFGTGVGRLLVRHVVLPFGGAYIALAVLLHLWEGFFPSAVPPQTPLAAQVQHSVPEVSSPSPSVAEKPNASEVKSASPPPQPVETPAPVETSSEQEQASRDSVGRRRDPARKHRGYSRGRERGQARYKEVSTAERSGREDTGCWRKSGRQGRRRTWVRQQEQHSCCGTCAEEATSAGVLCGLVDSRDLLVDDPASTEVSAKAWSNL